MKNPYYFLFVSTISLLLTAHLYADNYADNYAEKATSHPTATPAKPLAGGGATVFATGSNAFSLPSANMPLMEKLDFNVGNSFFRNPWVVAPASTDARDGLGPLMNTNGCQNCHIRDGRGHAPANTADNAVSLLVRLSIPSANGPLPEPNYGEQLQDFAIPGIPPEGRLRITYQPVDITLAGGEVVTLRDPQLQIDELAYGDLHPQTQFSARIAPPMIGLGLLEAIAERDILQQADPDDRDGDGISGRANRVRDIQAQSMALGRFGWKAGQPTVRQQNAAAFNGDLGITSHLFPKDHCTQGQADCLKAVSGGAPELSDKILDLVTHYAKNLAVPAQRQRSDPDVLQGEKLFKGIGCADCHTPQWQTAKDYVVPWLAQQTIYPYTDLLLHDMGEGLADHRPEARANGREWRTPPLWGIGLTQVVSGESHFLHDGRARNLTEAILWHGGEAKSSQQTFIGLPKEQRERLIAFLNSL